MKIIDKLAWIAVHDKKVLSTRSIGKEKWYIPGGKRETGESDEQALLREIKEELSVDLIPESLEYFGTFSAQADGHQEGIEVKMQCYMAQYHGQLKASAEIAEWTWLTTADRYRIAPVDQLIFNELVKRKMIV